MHKLQNGSQVTLRPARKPQIGTGGYFSENNESGAPSYPGQDWFNDCTDEFLNALAAAGVTYDPTKTDHFVKLLMANGNQFAPYRADRIYQCGEVCYTVTAGKVSYWEWYSNVESLAGKDPLNTANRRIGWTDVTKPFYWKPYTPKVPGETMAWDNDAIPENMVVGIGQQLPVAVYHSLAAAKPEWIDETDNSLINIPDRQGRFVRAADGATWLAGETHEDAIRNIVGNFGNLMGTSNAQTNTSGVFEGTYIGNNNLGGSSVSYHHTYAFKASRVVPTASENQPKAFIEWVGYAL
jgi:hypothetical protein